MVSQHFFLFKLINYLPKQWINKTCLVFCCFFWKKKSHLNEKRPTNRKLLILLTISIARQLLFKLNYSMDLSFVYTSGCDVNVIMANLNYYKVNGLMSDWVRFWILIQNIFQHRKICKRNVVRQFFFIFIWIWTRIGILIVK